MAMERENRPARGGVRKRKKVCQFCVDKCEHIDYKDAAKLRRFISERSKILPRRHASAPADRGHQARPSDRSAALRHRVRRTTCNEKLHPMGGAFFACQKPIFVIPNQCVGAR